MINVHKKLLDCALAALLGAGLAPALGAQAVPRPDSGLPRDEALHPGTMASGLCSSGRRQSPIDIVATRKAALAPLRFAYRSGPARVVNDGHTVRFRVPPGSQVEIGSDKLGLQQLHFHIPGGDRIEGEAFPMAMHFLHKNSAGQLISIVVPFRLGTEHPALAALLPQMPERGQPEHALAGLPLDPNQLLPPAHGYYAYEGSLTAPPCTEGVRWIVLKQAQTLSPAQLAQLQHLFPNNARAVQPLNGRAVLESP